MRLNGGACILFYGLLTACVTSCDRHKALQLETMEMHKQIVNEEQQLRQTQAQLVAIGHLGQFNAAGSNEFAVAKANVQVRVQDKERVARELAEEKEKLEKLKTQLADYQAAQFKASRP